MAAPVLPEEYRGVWVPDWIPGDPLPDPGLAEHQWRPTDVDPAAEKRAERQVAAFFVLAMVCAILFIVAYVTLEIGTTTTTFLNMGASTVALGASLGGAMLFIGIGALVLAAVWIAAHTTRSSKKKASA